MWSEFLDAGLKEVVSIWWIIIQHSERQKNGVSRGIMNLPKIQRGRKKHVSSWHGMIMGLHPAKSLVRC